ncbi:nuclear pore complex protein Nup88 [Frankliniella occidentalis]|uniref:Nuclear pore complex protein Nup88 n=1 Tax=Frankliniella occidentalis TaxID=133901 RepID=A0A9C6X3A5_FRAOC|nr:nuclear pore complex protein Nup88 [Frankliniella occidentalis]
MALSTDRLNLNNHEIFRKIRERLPNQQLKTKNLMVCSDDMLFVWDPVEECLLTLSLRSPDREGCPEERAFQTLLPQSPPSFPVERIRCSDTGRQVALYGPRGVAVLDVPRRWDLSGKFQQGSKTCRCRTVLAAPAVEVRQVRWHPGSPADSHLLVLTSDNSLRLYNSSANPEIRQLQVVHLGRAPIGGIMSSSKLPLLGGLGETAVDFDFAPPLTLKGKRTTAGGRTADADVEWPIMVLRGNGDVYSVLVPLAAKDGGALPRPVVRGPLTMYPPADDNYGVDACSVLVLQTSPPLLVVATSAGTLYHCLLLSPEDGGGDAADLSLRDLSIRDLRDLSAVDDEDALRKEVSKMWTSVANNSLAGQPVLHVFESVELELGLSLDDDLLGDVSFNCPLHLQNHPTSNDRYLVSHEAGIHILFLPIVAQLTKFVNASDDYAESCLPKFDSQSNSVAEYLLCTRVCGGGNGNVPSESSTTSPILGLALSSAPATLIALLAGGEVVSLLLSSLHLPSISSQSILSLNSLTGNPKLNEEAFDEHIRKLLKHRGTLPIFKFEEKAMSSPQEALKFINRGTQLLYEKYFQRHEQAHEDIENRMKRLQRIKEHQLSDLSNLEKERSDLKSKVEVLVEKLNEMKKKQEELSDRAERVLRNANMKQPQVSNAEVQMRKDLSTKQIKLVEMREKLDKIRKYSMDQKSQLDRWNLHQKKRVVPMNDTHQDVIKNNLKQMREELSSLVEKVKSSQTELEL